MGHWHLRRSRGTKHGVWTKASFPHLLASEDGFQVCLPAQYFLLFCNLDFRALKGSSATQVLAASLFPVGINLATSHICYLSVFLFYFFATLHGLWDLSAPIRD